LRVDGRAQSHDNVNQRSRDDYRKSASFCCARFEEVEIMPAQLIGDVPVVEDQQVLKTSRAVMVGTVDDFAVGKFTIVDVRGRDIGIYRAFDGRWHAVRNLCPHRGAPLCVGPVGGTVMPSEPGEVIFGMEEEVVRCPWHAMEFSLLTGESLFDVSPVSVSVHYVEVSDGEVWVEVRPKQRRRANGEIASS
jgi:nitrite reductase (NADH) small subunit